MSGVPDYPVGVTLDFKFTTRAFATGIPTTLAGTPAIEIYENNSTTQITAGITLTVDFDGITGLNHLRVVATGANGFESLKSYQCVISAGTVGGVSVVGEVVQQFSLERSPSVNVSSWNGVSLATTNPLPNVAAGAAGGLPTDTDPNGAVRVVDGTGLREINTSGGNVFADVTFVNGVPVTYPMDVNVAEWDGSAAAVKNSVTSGLPQMDVESIADNTQAALDLSDFALSGYDPATNKVEGVKLVDTTTTNTDMRGTNGAATPGAAMTLTPGERTAVADAQGTRQIPESYAANGAAPTNDQATMAIHQMLMQFGIAGTNLTVRRLNNTTTAFVVTLDDDTNPTDAARV